MHAYTNLLVEKVLPLSLGEISEINLDLHWTYGLGDTVAQSTNNATMKANEVQTNVAVDMFFDADKMKAQNSSSAKFEVMVWFATFGDETQPLGLDQGAVKTKTLDNAEL